ncbi:MAG: hypothetical protein CVU84_14705 [Firmicutes bacterium HGW-Firmicutes-1]|jgi:diguanylate cyclase (GGDEF)-like protein|nr:MAG: hypothetical protein CVU84_14705 [Firmicutes bacterium HGW-Firmicutes-1]
MLNIRYNAIGGYIAMLKKVFSFLNIPKIDDELENKYYAYIFSADIVRLFYLFGSIFLISSLFSTYYTILYKKTNESHYLVSATMSFLMMLFILVFFYILKHLKTSLSLQTKRNFLVIIPIQNIMILSVAISISLLEKNIFILFSFIMLIATLIFVTPAIIFIQHLIVTILYSIFMMFFFEFDATSFCSTLLMIFVSSIISYAVYLNKLTEFQLFSKFKEKNMVLKEYNRELSVYSYSDALTGVNNRRRIEDILKSNWKYCKLNSQNLSIIIIDIDNFKKYNDCYGHVKGDACLVEVATAIEDLCLEFSKNHYCSMGRYGGEEFIIILPVLEKEEAIHFAKQVCEKIESLNILHKDNDKRPYVTISGGVTTMVPDDEKRILYILESADRALYHVKRNGKNNAMHYSDLCLD